MVVKLGKAEGFLAKRMVAALVDRYLNGCPGFGAIRAVGLRSGDWQQLQRASGGRRTGDRRRSAAGSPATHDLELWSSDWDVVCAYA